MVELLLIEKEIRAGVLLITSPVDGTLLSTVPLSSAKDLDIAVNAARIALPSWRARNLDVTGARFEVSRSYIIYIMLICLAYL
jgi:acyl-CoA reductase-like NAD-dependent aldehyde dehydrogenase